MDSTREDRMLVIGKNLYSVSIGKFCVFHG